MTGFAPPSPRICAAARATLVDLPMLAALTPTQRADLVMVAFDILRDARTARLGQKPAPAAPAQLICIPRADFTAGRSHPRRPRLTVRPGGPTPGDAA